MILNAFNEQKSQPTSPGVIVRIQCKMSYLTTKLVNRLSVGVIFIVMIIKYILVMCTMNELWMKSKVCTTYF